MYAYASLSFKNEIKKNKIIQFGEYGLYFNFIINLLYVHL